MPSAPGDRSHIPAASKPIFDTLSAELSKLRQTTPVRYDTSEGCMQLVCAVTESTARLQPQQVKIVNDTEKRLNILFDMLNCETLSETSTKRLVELCQGEHDNRFRPPDLRRVCSRVYLCSL